MPKTVKSMIEEANAAVPRISIDEARKLIAAGDALIVDVRDAPELEKTGRIAGAVHVSRGMLEFRADSDSPYHAPEFRKDRPVMVYCASGGRSALSGKLLKDMGFSTVYNLGAFKDWVEAGGSTEGAFDPGM
ncbi:MAG: rhodanese-like domain-containing protein [Nitratireductor sp.]|nr:rhodanese-like domain-containing protein [Nitratireductor sp.]